MVSNIYSLGQGKGLRSAETREHFPSVSPSCRNRMGHINVDYLAGTKGWALTVDDDGVGMPTGEEKLVPGLGTGIVEALSRQPDAAV